MSEATPPEGARCPRCGEALLPGERFCENCGTDLTAPAGEAPAAAEGAPDGPGAAVSTAAAAAPAGTARPCVHCGGAVAEDGYCGTCGAPAAKERDHWVEQPAGWLAGVCDRGIRHDRNEDAMAIAAGPEPGRFGVLVVCDGVSSSSDSDVASLAAARAARDVLAVPVEDGGSVAGRIDRWTRLLTEAGTAANDAAAAVARRSGPSGNPPSCTFAAAVVDGPVTVAGWVGDSRVYWLPDGGTPVQLSTDDSWAAEQIALGVPREEAETGPRAHAITRWLGIDSPAHQPRCAAVGIDVPGWLLVCSDGLWNYCSAADEMAALVARTTAAAGGEPLATARALVRWANEQGGHDNITVALARPGGADPSGGSPHPAAAAGEGD